MMFNSNFLLAGIVLRMRLLSFSPINDRKLGLIITTIIIIIGRKAVDVSAAGRYVTPSPQQKSPPWENYKRLQEVSSESEGGGEVFPLPEQAGPQTRSVFLGQHYPGAGGGAEGAADSAGAS